MKINFMMPIGNKKPTKVFELNENTWIKISDYPSMTHFRGIEQEVDDLKDFCNLLKKIFDKNVFMIHGEFIEEIDLNNMVRRSRDKHKDGIAPTIKDRFLDLFVIDVDNHECDHEKYSQFDNIEMFKILIDDFILNELPIEFSNADYVYQFSSSFGLTSLNKLKVHIFFTPKNPIHNTTLRNWANSWNKSKGKTVIDPSVYRAVQPIYTMRRIINFDEDPVKKECFIGYVSKNNKLLNWEPSDIEQIKSNEETKTVNLVSMNNNYDISTSIREILTSENYHDRIRSTALSLINKNVSAKDTRIFLEEFMYAAKNNIMNDFERLADWQLRYDDIPRAVNSAIEIVGIPDFDEILNWILNGSEKEIKKEFSKKMINFEGTELKYLVREIDEKLNFGSRAINEDIRNAKFEKKEELQKIAKKIKSEERKNQNIFEIEISNSSYGSATNSICKILSASNKKPEVYKLGNTLSVIQSSIPKTIRQITQKNQLKCDYPEMPIIHDISATVGVIRTRVEKDCVFFNQIGKEIVCPDSILIAVPKMYGINWKPLSGIVEHPFINDNWELVDKQGYDPKTGLYAVLHKKLKITIIDPFEAYKYLVDEVFSEFPFQTKLDTAAAVGMFISAIQRPYVIGDSGMPGYAIVSPKPSSGKTTLAQLLSYSIYNRPVAATGWSDNDEELGKHLLAILREGHSCILFDNIKKDAAIKSNELAKAMTSGTYSRRKLGSNETEEVPSSVLWIFTGNNIVFKGDFATRILPIRIVPSAERPEFRKFKRKDIGQWAMDNRKKIISALISIIMCGKDIDHDSIDLSARFKEWDKFVRMPIMKVSGQDLLHVFNKNDFLDDENTAKGDLLELLYGAFEDNSFSTKDIMKLLEGHAIGNVGVDNTGDDFRHAIEDAFNEKATQSRRTLGRFILGMKDLILRGYMLIREDGQSIAKWRVVKAYEDEH